jgi:protein-tyrosine-phosphatase
MKNIKRILVVCTGNSCRSIMAEGYLIKKLKDMGVEDTIVISAGTNAINGLKPTDETIEVMKEEGVDVSGYVSSGLTKTNIDNADAVLVMTEEHKKRILTISPSSKDKVYLLKAFSEKYKKDDNSIGDPIGRPIEFYRDIFKIIKDSSEGFIKWIKE